MKSQTQTISDLHPSHLDEIKMMKTKTSQRLQGSYMMSLSRPNRVIETSRKYIHGDPVAMIDWKAFARSDQLIVREKKDEASAYVRIGIDLSDSMKFSGVHRRSCAKQEVALRVALNLAHIHLDCGDLVEVWIVHQGELKPKQRYRPRSPSDVVGIFEQMKSSNFDDRFLLGRKSDPENQKSDQVYWVGDLLGEGDVKSFLNSGKRGCVFQTLHSDELDVDWLEPKDCYFDHGVELKEFTGEKLKLEYSQQIKQWLESQEVKFTQIPWAYKLISNKTKIIDYFQFLETLPLRIVA